MSIKRYVRGLTPSFALRAYHFLTAWLAAAWYRFPSKQLMVIGVTGTKGKTTTANFIWAVLQAGGKRTGLTGTAVFRLSDRQMLNPYHMTMPNPFIIQRFLRELVEEGCTHCVIETTSEGMAQKRHIGVWYDMAVFTNISPEHIDSHGSYEAYRAAKGRLFRALMQHPKKILEGEPVERIALVNKDAADHEFFLAFPADKVATFGLSKGADYVAEGVKSGPAGASFRVKDAHYAVSLLGEFNVRNALPAVAVGEILGIEPGVIAQGLASLKVVPGRMEVIEEGQLFRVIVDYAHEKVSMEAALSAVREFVGLPALPTGPAGGRQGRKGKVVVLLGAEGGGRDKAKRPLMGEIAGRLADYVVVSNVDPYDDDPKEIIEDIARAAEAAGKVRDKNLFCIEDRRKGIRKAFSLMGKGDLALITGKGAEQSMILKEGTIEWDDRLVVREELQAMGHKL